MAVANFALVLGCGHVLSLSLSIFSAFFHYNNSLTESAALTCVLLLPHISGEQSSTCGYPQRRRTKAPEPPQRKQHSRADLERDSHIVREAHRRGHGHHMKKKKKETLKVEDEVGKKKGIMFLVSMLVFVLKVKFKFCWLIN